jgi:hypothetical protein
MTKLKIEYFRLFRPQSSGVHAIKYDRLQKTLVCTMYWARMMPNIKPWLSSATELIRKIPADHECGSEIKGQ